MTATAGLGGQVPSYDVALADFDGDGRLDVYAPNHATGAVLYRNAGDFRFEDVTARAGIVPAGDQHGCGWGDADGDGRPDLYVALGADHGRAVKSNRLYRNAGGRLVRVESAAGATDPRGRGVTWVDYDRDGHLDVFVANFATPNALFRNRGEGTFVDATKEAKVPRWPPAPGAAFGDGDGDGDLDLVLANGKDYPIGLSEREGVVAFTQLRPKPDVALVFETSVANPPLRLVERDTPIAPDDPRLALGGEGSGRRELRWRGEHALSGRAGPGVRASRLEGCCRGGPAGPADSFSTRATGPSCPHARSTASGPGATGRRSSSATSTTTGISTSTSC